MKERGLKYDIIERLFWNANVTYTSFWSIVKSDGHNVFLKGDVDEMIHIA